MATAVVWCANWLLCEAEVKGEVMTNKVDTLSEYEEAIVDIEREAFSMAVLRHTTTDSVLAAMIVYELRKMNKYVPE